MKSGLILRVETGVERVASSLFAAAIAYAAYAALSASGFHALSALAAAGGGAVAYLFGGRLQQAASGIAAEFPMRPFELRIFHPFDPDSELLLTDADRVTDRDELVLTKGDRLAVAGELLLTDADRLRSEEPLLLDDILADIGSDSRVVRLFDRKSMPTPGQLEARIASHLGAARPVETPSDAAQALSQALAELRRSLG